MCPPSLTTDMSQTSNKHLDRSNKVKRHRDEFKPRQHHKLQYKKRKKAKEVSICRNLNILHYAEWSMTSCTLHVKYLLVAVLHDCAVQCCSAAVGAVKTISPLAPSLSAPASWRCPLHLLELPTNLCKFFTITKKAPPTRASLWLKAPT